MINSAIVAFITLLAAGFIVYGYLDRKQSLTDARDQLTVLTNVLTESIEAQLSVIERQMVGMQALMTVRDLLGPEADRPIRDALLDWCQNDRSCMDLLVIDERGEIIQWTGAGSPPAVADREYFATHLTDGARGVYIGIPLLSRVHADRWFFAVSNAERDEDGRLKRVYVSIRDLSRSFDYAAIVRQANGSSFAVAATSGEVYVREPDRERHMGKVIPQVELVLAESTVETKATQIVSRIDGVERLIVTRRLTRYPLFAAATRETDEILLHWRHRLFLVFGLWAVLAALALYVGRRLCDDARLQDYLASIDGLTGILNRRALMSEARRHEERRSDADGLGLMMVDVDHFKRINDSFGHVVGDEVLRRVAATLRMSSRGTDVLGRYGGEEFLLILPGADESRLAKVGEKLRAAVEAIPALEFSGREGFPDTLTVSVGGAVLRAGEGNLDHAIARADLALYEAKHAGRNRVVVTGATG